MALGLIQSFNGDGSTKVFQIIGEILSKNHIGVWLNENTTRENTNTYDVFGNTIIFKVAPITGTIIKIAVSDDGEGLDDSPSEINTLQSYIEEIDLVADYVEDIERVAVELNTTNVLENIGNDLELGVNSEIRKANANKTNIDKVVSLEQKMDSTITLETKMDYTKDTLESKIDNVISLEYKIIDITEEPLRQSIIDAEDNAGIATTKASEASVSALNAQLNKWIAEANKKTADSYATEPEDVFVKIYTSNGDGTFSYTNSTEYSALHWATKALELVTDGVIDDDTPSVIKTYSSEKIESIASAISLTVSNNMATTQALHNSQQSDILGKVVHISGNQIIEDVKTFTSSPIVPTPTTDMQVSTKKYVDDVVGQLSTDFYQGAYGISWDYATDTYIRTGAKGYTAIQSRMKRCVVKADGTVNYYLNPYNSNFKEDGTPSVLTGADGNVMVEIPKHYIKVETVGNVDSFSISLTPEPGYVLDPSFLKWNGTAMVEVPYRYFRAYEGFVSGEKLLSVSGVTPTRSQTIATFRTQAMANGAGWHLTDWNLLNTIKRLCYIEFCDFIVTKYLGEGNYTGADYGITTGQSNALGNRSSNSTDNDKYMSYRGIENMYADIWEFVDGVNVNNYQFYVNGNYSTFQSDVFTGGYVAKGPLAVAGANSLIERCAVSSDGWFIPTVVGGSTTTFYGDALWSATGARIVLYGGGAHDGASGGLGALYVNHASSHSDMAVGAAVCR